MISVDVFLCESWMIMLIKQILCAKNCLFLGTNRFMQGVFSLLTYIKYRYQPSFWYFHKSNLLVFAGTKTILNRQYPPDIVVDTKGKNWFVSTSFRTLYLSLNQLAKKKAQSRKEWKKCRENLFAAYNFVVFIFTLLHEGEDQLSRRYSCFRDASETCIGAWKVKQKIQKIKHTAKFTFKSFMCHEKTYWSTL